MKSTTMTSAGECVCVCASVIGDSGRVEVIVNWNKFDIEEVTLTYVCYCVCFSDVTFGRVV